jgi:hypothetical protein
VAVVMICMFRQYTCRKLGGPGGDLMAAKSMGPGGEPQVSPLRYAPVPRHAGAGEMTILFVARSRRFHEGSAEPQVPRLRS